MITEQQATTMLAFLEQYSAFLTAMSNDEKEKLAALVSNSLERIERAILTGQANAKQMDSMEKKRMALQEELSCGGYSLNELCEATPINLRVRMSELSQSVREAISDIRFNNDKSMSVARSNIIQVNPEAVLASVKQEGTNPYARAKNKEHDQTSILTTKA